MTNRVVEGFATYGTGAFPANPQVPAACLAGAWAEMPTFAVVGGPTIDVLPWAPGTTDLYLQGCWPRDATGGNAPRRVIPTGAADKVILSCYYAMPQLPDVDAAQEICVSKDAGNNTLHRIVVRPTGIIAIYNAAGALVAQTAVPVIVASTATHLEMLFQQSTSTIQIYVNGVQMLTTAAATMSAQVAQFMFLGAPFATAILTYGCITNIIIRDGAGSVNNGIAGDRRVATLLVNNDRLSNQGWTARPLKRFGNGILNNAYPTTPANFNAGITMASTIATDIGAGDFTIEGNFRFKSLPTAANKAVLFGKWDETLNKRSYQLYLGGPSLDSGQLCFRISTDGLNGTVAQKILYPFQFDVGRWYHIAVVRSSNNLLLFIDGVQYGTAIASAETYFAATTLTVLGGQNDNGTGTPILNNTGFNGWVDEFRYTKAFARYTAPFSPPVAAFPRTVGGDPQFNSVGLLCGFESGIADDSSNGFVLTARNGAVAQTPNDGVSNFQVMAKNTPPLDDSFLEAAFVQATQTLTLTANPANGETVRLGTTNGVTAATYTFKTVLASAFDVLIGASASASIANLVNAIILGPGSGTAYHAGTTVNFDATASQLPGLQMLATAILGGTAGNSIVTTETLANGSWGAGTMAGGANLPANSQFGLQKPPQNTTLVDSVTFAMRLWKTQAGTATVRQSFVGSAGGVLNGASTNMTTVPTLYFDTFEVDPDTAGPITPTTIIGCFVKLDRTA